MKIIGYSFCSSLGVIKSPRYGYRGIICQKNYQDEYAGNSNDCDPPGHRNLIRNRLAFMGRLLNQRVNELIFFLNEIEVAALHESGALFKRLLVKARRIASFAIGLFLHETAVRELAVLAYARHNARNLFAYAHENQPNAFIVKLHDFRTNVFFDRQSVAVRKSHNRKRLAPSADGLLQKRRQVAQLGSAIPGIPGVNNRKPILYYAGS